MKNTLPLLTSSAVRITVFLSAMKKILRSIGYLSPSAAIASAVDHSNGKKFKFKAIYPNTRELFTDTQCLKLVSMSTSLEVNLN